MLEFDKVNHYYGTHHAVCDLSFTLREGELGVIIGPSGCGKTSTLRMVNRLIQPTGGSIRFMDRDLDAWEPVALRRSMGYVIQSVGLFPHWTVGENVAAVPTLLKWDPVRIRERVRAMLDLVGLDPDLFAHKYPSELSGGEAQRVGIARALAADPPLLLMDEPFGALDPVQKARLQQVLLDIQARIRKTILLITHDLDEAIVLADRILIMNQGRLIQHDTPEEILRAPASAFVRNFVGADRSLKRLLRRRVEEILEPCTPLALGYRSEVDVRRPWHWVVDAGGILQGWVDTAEVCHGGEGGIACTDWEDAISPLDARTMPLRPGSNLKDTLSYMLSTGIRLAPVTDEGGRLLGEVSMDSIQDLTREAR